MKFYIFKVLIISILIAFSISNIYSQKTAAYEEPSYTYKSALALFNRELYGAAKAEFTKIIISVKDENSDIRIAAEYYNALCAVELFNDDAEILLNEFIRQHPESAYLRNIYFQLGKFQYRKKNYKGTIKSFEKVDELELTKDEQAEFYFKQGYSLFKNDKLELAEKSFYQIIERENNYKNLAVYYYSHIAYLNHNYETALKGFLSLQDDEYFKQLIPYYITHIYYMQKKYDELLEIAGKLLETSTPQRKSEIYKFIGEAYYNLEKYAEAIPYLKEYYNSSNPTPSNQYQLGYANFMIANYAEAITYFNHIEAGTDSLAQNANYHLALCYLKIGKKSYALNSFEYAYKSYADSKITEDALYNYAKLSYELDYNPYNNAIVAFQKYLNDYPKSQHNQEIMEYLTKMYLSTKNYKQAKLSIEKIKNPSPEMNAAYQRILYAMAIENFNANDYNSALDLFSKSASMKYNPEIVPQSIFWKAESYYRIGEIDKSIAGFKEFLVTKGAITLDYFNKANYNIGYGLFSQKKYDDANIFYRIYIRNENDSSSMIFNDAILRVADCYFMQSQFDKSVNYYDKALALGKIDNDYAIYKKAESLGAMGNWKAKVEAFETLLSNYSNSSYAGNAELELAKSYFNALNNNSKAIEHYTHIIDNYPKQQNFVKKAMVDLGLVYSNIGEPEKAIEIWKKVNEYYKGTEESKDALDAMREVYVSMNKVDDFFNYATSLGIKPSISQQDSVSYRAAENLYMAGDCDKSSQGFIEYISRFPAGSFITNAYFYLADCEFRASFFDKALQDYNFISTLPVSPFTEKSWERIAYIYYYKKDDFQKALSSYKSLLQTAEYKNNIQNAKIGIMRSLWNIHDTLNVFQAAENVLTINNLESDIKNEALMIKAKSAMAMGKDSIGISTLNQIIKSSHTEDASEARFIIAKKAFNDGDYNKSESIVYDIIQQDPSYEYWVAKALVLSADIFVKTDNENQAVATLQSIISKYHGDEALINEAKSKLEAINSKNSKNVKGENKEDELIIHLETDDNKSGIFKEKELDDKNKNSEENKN